MDNFDIIFDTREDVKDLRLHLGRLKMDTDRLVRKLRLLQVHVDVIQADVRWLRKAMHVLLTHHGLSVEPERASPEQ